MPRDCLPGSCRGDLISLDLVQVKLWEAVDRRNKAGACHGLKEVVLLKFKGSQAATLLASKGAIPA